MLARWIGFSFLLLATYTLSRGVWQIATGQDAAERSPLGLFLTIFASFGMPFISRMT